MVGQHQRHTWHSPHPLHRSRRGRAQNLNLGPAMELAWWARSGISQKNEARFNAALGVLLMLFITGWSYAVYRSFAFNEPPPSLTSAVTASPLSSEAPPAAAYLTDAAVNAFTSDL